MNKCILRTCRHFRYTSSVSSNTGGPGPLSLYKHKVATNALKYDAGQEATAVELQTLFDKVVNIDQRMLSQSNLGAAGKQPSLRLEKYAVPIKSSTTISPERNYSSDVIKPSSLKESTTIWKKLFGGDSPAPDIKGTPKVRGIWLYGDVGSGKTMLMEMFYSSLTSVQRKRRVHFDSFMLEVYRDLWKWQNSKETGKKHAMQVVATRIFEGAYVLCFDEFQVADMASSQMLYQLFDKLFHMGTVCVITSNRVPDDLHKGGGQKESFEPFVNLLKEYCQVWTIKSNEDYRLTAKAEGSLTGEESVYYLTHDQSCFKNCLDRIYKNSGLERAPAEINLYGRTLKIPQATRNSGELAEFEYEQLFSDSAALGPADYLLLCETYSRVSICKIPKMSLTQKNEARRFITFVDAAYENKTKLIISAAAAPEHLFAGSESQLSKETLAEDFGGDPGHQSIATSTDVAKYLPPLFTGEEEIFAFKRTISRLNEMQSVKYAEQQHNPQKTRQFLDKVAVRTANFTNIPHRNH